MNYFEPEMRPTKKGQFPKASLPFYGDVSLGNSTQYKVGMFIVPSGRLFIGVEGKGSYTFAGWCHWHYAMEKLDFKFQGDAMNFADFINSQLGHPLEFEDRICQGLYDSGMTRPDLDDEPNTEVDL